MQDLGHDLRTDPCLRLNKPIEGRADRTFRRVLNGRHPVFRLFSLDRFKDILDRILRQRANGAPEMLDACHVRKGGGRAQESHRQLRLHLFILIHPDCPLD